MSRAVLLVALLGACSPANAGFGDVQREVRDRIGARVAWTDGDDAPPVTSPEVRRLLAHPLDAERAMRIALLNDRGLAAAVEELGIARATLAGERMPNPEVEGAYRFGDGPHGSEIEAGASLPLLALLQTPGRRAVASAALRAAQADAAGAALDVALGARRAYQDLAAAARIAALARTSLETAAAALDVAERMHEAGGGTALDIAARQVSYEEARLALAEAELDQRGARERLSVALGLYGDALDFSLAPSPDLPAEEAVRSDVEAAAIARSLDLEGLRERYEAETGRASLARWGGLVPELAAGVGVEREDGDLHVGPSLRLELPLFDQAQGASGRAAARARQLEHRYAATAVRIRSAARVLADRVVSLHARARFVREALVPARERHLAETVLRYNGMLAGVFELLAARGRVVDAERARIRAERDYWIARAELDTLLAGRAVDARAVPGASTGGASDGDAGGH